jgi:hypothetical protein
MRYTSGWAQTLKSDEEFDRWVSSLTDGDRVLFQQFIPRGKGCLDSQIECWRFWEATFHGGTVKYNNAHHPLKDGRAVYWNSDSLHGNVFGSRIVPWHSDMAPDEGLRHVDGHAPIFESAWTGFDRIFVLVPFGPNFHEYKKRLNFKHKYYREVREGFLFTIFGMEEEDVKALIWGMHSDSPDRF